MNKIDEKLLSLKKVGHTGLMTHIVVGYPTISASFEVAKTMAEAGADFIELQIPFSDPIADGPTIMRACEEALARGARVRDVFPVAKVLSSKVAAPLLFMAYYNTVFKYGIRRFCRDAKRAGISGLIVPDFPIEEESREHLALHARQNDLHLIRVVAPVSTKSRLIKNAAVAKGFIYCSSRQGITGTRKRLDFTTLEYLKNVRNEIVLPIAVGFGISTPIHVRQIAPYADVIIVGSAIVEAINCSTARTVVANIRRFVRSLKQACL